MLECIEVIAVALEQYETQLPSVSLREALRALAANNAVCGYTWLRLALESTVQYTYYKLLGVEWSEALKRISKRSRFAASFSATMIKELKGVHGSRKKWIMRVYLRLNEWLHPSIQMISLGGINIVDWDLVREVLDVIAYLAVLIGSNIDYVLASRCGLEKTLRLLARRVR
jgi:hypothetical protein